MVTRSVGLKIIVSVMSSILGREDELPPPSSPPPPPSPSLCLWTASTASSHWEKHTDELLLQPRCDSVMTDSEGLWRGVLPVSLKSWRFPRTRRHFSLWRHRWSPETSREERFSLFILCSVRFTTTSIRRRTTHHDGCEEMKHPGVVVDAFKHLKHKQHYDSMSRTNTLQQESVSSLLQYEY